jgi:uncharacterized protein YjbI with pentapeptide repeats
MAVAVGGSVAEAADAVTCPTVSASGVVTPAPAPGVDWDHCDLTDANLSGAELSGANLDYAIMTGADLSGASLTDATLYAAIFKSANLSSADFTGATMTMVSSGLVTASPAPTLPADWQLIGSYLVGPQADLDYAELGDANLSSADLAGAYLESAILNGANLDGADLDGAEMSGATLTDAGLNDANLTNAALAQVVSGGITGTTTLLPVDWQLKSGYLAGPQASLSYADAPGVNLSGTDLDDASFFAADLDGADLSKANLIGVDATGADLENANLTDVNLTDAAIGGEAFVGGGAATLEGADLAGATLTGIGSGFIDGGPAVLPAHWMFAGGYLLGPTAYLEYEGVLQGLDLAGVDLASARVSSVEFEQDNLANADFRGSDAAAGNFSEDTWSNTTCPDGNNSNLYVSGCFSARRYDLAGFVTPKSGATLSKSPRSFPAEFRLTNPATGAAVAGATARALTSGHDVRAILAGPKIKTETVTCSWVSRHRYFSCTVPTPAKAKTGTRHRYTITLQVNQGPGFLSALPARGVTNPETIHFS